MKCSDYIAQELVEAGITEVFSVTGGMIMHLTDSFAKHPKLRVTYMHGEAACVIACESYFRLTGKLACALVTSGPGATNAIPGVFGAWTDSMGVLVISGQCRRDTINHDPLLRQLGDQEIDIVPMVKKITKYCAQIDDPRHIGLHLDKAIHWAKDKRPGPVWLSIPVDIQSLAVESSTMTRSKDIPFLLPDPDIQVKDAYMALKGSHRPVIIAGAGIRISGEVGAFRTLVESLHIPVVTAFNAHDLLEDGHPCLVGRQGTIGDIPGNMAVQNSDCLLILGSRMNIRSVGYDWANFAPKAFKIQVDIDEAEMHKHTLHVDLPIHADVRDFIFSLMGQSIDGYTPYLAQCKEWLNAKAFHYPWVRRLFDTLKEDDIIVCANASACIMPFQEARLKKGQRMYSNSGSASMGWALPAAIGAARGAREGQRVICIEGDGSLQMSVAELATVSHNALNIEIVLIENNGYSSIKQTQERWFPDNLTGFDSKTGVWFPYLDDLSRAYCTIIHRVFVDSKPFNPRFNDWKGVTL